MKKIAALFMCGAMSLALCSGMAYADEPDPNAKCPSAGCLATDPGALNVPDAKASEVANGIISTLSIIAGVLSVIFLVIGGIRYTTSSGNAQRVESAKQTLIYAVIGLIISILAPVIAGFIITKSP